jgi:hypothetical protein
MYLIADTSNHCILKAIMLENGTLNSSIFISGLNFPMSVQMIDEDTIAVADDNNRISMFSANGTLINQTRLGASDKIISSIRLYGETLLVTKTDETNTSVYYVTIESIPFFNQIFQKITYQAPGILISDSLILMNGTFIGAQYDTYRQYSMNYTFPSYKTKPTKSPSISRSVSFKETISQSSSLSLLKETFTHSRTRSTEDTTSHSGTYSERNTPTRSIKETSTHSIEGTLTYSERNMPTRSIEETLSQSLKKISTRSIEGTLTRSTESSESQSGRNTLSRLLTYSSGDTISRSSEDTISFSATMTSGKKDINPVVSLTVPISTKAVSMTFSGTGTNAMRTATVLMIMNGQCGKVKDFELYENPFGVVYISIGNICITMITMFIFFSIGYLIELCISHDYPDLSRLVLKYKVLDIGYFLWALFMPSTIIAFVQYTDPIDTTIGSLWILLTTGYIFYKLRDAFPVEVRELITWKERLMDHAYDWEADFIIIPLIEGYKKRKYVILDIIYMYIMAISTVSENCLITSVLLICINVIYLLSMILLQPAQPLITLLGNVILAGGQVLVLILLLCNVDAQVLMMVTNTIGTFLIYAPLLNKLFLNKKNRQTNRNVAPVLDISDFVLEVPLLENTQPPEEETIEFLWSETTLPAEFLDHQEEHNTTTDKASDKEEIQETIEENVIEEENAAEEIYQEGEPEERSNPIPRVKKVFVL